MNFKDFFDIDLPPILEGWAKPLNLSDGEKSNVNLSLDDVQSVPTKFKLYFTFAIEFNSPVIREDFEQKINKPDEKDLQIQIKKSMVAKTTGMVSIEPKFVDYKRFYYDVVKKELSAKSVQKSLDNFAQAGTFSLQDFSILKIDYPLIKNIKVNDIILWKQFVGKDKKNAKASPIKLQFGYSIEFAANNKLKMYSRTEIIKLAKSFVPEFESSMLKNGDYFSFMKNVLPMKEQNVFGIPLKLWVAGESDIVAPLDEQNIFDEPNELFPPTIGPKAPPRDPGDKAGQGPILTGDSGKKIAARIMSGINYAIGKMGMRELRAGRILTGIPELIRVINHAYRMPPEEEFPKEIIAPNVKKWFNMHDPIVDKVPLIMMDDGRIKIIKAEEIRTMEKARAREKELQGAKAPAGAAY